MVTAHFLMPLFIHGLFELSGNYTAGKSELAAATLAVRHVNEQKVVPGYELQLLVNDSRCDPGAGIDALFHGFYTKPEAIMLLGAGCSQVSIEIAQIVPHWNLLQVSYASMSPALSNKNQFPLFFRTVAPDASHNRARRVFIQKFQWETVAVFTQDDDLASLGTNDLISELEAHDIDVGITVNFLREDYKEQMLKLKESDLRIIIGSFSEKMARKVFCEAYHLGLYGADYVWIVQYPSIVWWNDDGTKNRRTRCSLDQMDAAIFGVLAVKSHNQLGSKIHSTTELTYLQFRSLMDQTGTEYSDTAALAYDAVWLIAITLQKAVAQGWKLHEFRYRDSPGMTTALHGIMGNVTFEGVSGPVWFRGSDRVGITAFYQIQGRNMAKLGLHLPTTKQLIFECTLCQPIIWQGGHVPVSHRIVKPYIITIDSVAFIIMTTLAVLGMMLSLCLLTFNVYYRNLKFIKMSSPNFNNLTIIGCLLIYGSVIIIGLDNATVDDDLFPGLCVGETFLLAVGFSLAFGSLFLKTYRVHQIFCDRAQSGVLKSKILKDKNLLPLLCSLLLLDCTIIGMWTYFDPPQRHLWNLTPEISESARDIVYLPQIEVCLSEHGGKWLAVLYAYKGLLLAMGAYMAWETRQVEIPALNDSHYIGLSVYNVMITSCTVVVIALLVVEHITLAYIIVSSLVLASTTATLCFLFVPKILIIWHSHDGNPVVESHGLHTSGNTKRFATDERKESRYRVQVQLQVHQKELAKLQQEAGRLERLLAEVDTTYTEDTTTS